MKQILIAGILSFGALSSPIFIQPAAAQTQLESIQDMAGWMQSVTQIQTDLTSLFSADALTQIYSVIDSGDEDAIRRLGQQFEAERQAVLARANLQISELSPPEKWKIDQSVFSRKDEIMFTATKKQYNSLQETYSLFDTLTKSFSEILNNPENLDEDGISGLLSVQHRASVRLIELENEQVDQFLAALPKSHPNYQFQEIVKQFNLATIHELKISMLENTLEDRQKNGEAFGAELEKIKKLIRVGRKNAQIELSRMEGYNIEKLGPSDKVMVPIAIQIFKNFDQAFDVEAEMLEKMLSSYNLYISDKMDENIQPLIDKNDLAYFRLIEARQEHMHYRLSLIQ